jgi:hypothetical protein
MTTAPSPHSVVSSGTVAFLAGTHRTAQGRDIGRPGLAVMAGLGRANVLPGRGQGLECAGLCTLSIHQCWLCLLLLFHRLITHSARVPPLGLLFRHHLARTGQQRAVRHVAIFPLFFYTLRLASGSLSSEFWLAERLRITPQRHCWPGRLQTSVLKRYSVR